MGRIAARIVLGLVAATVTLLLVEGSVSFLLGRSLLRPRPFVGLATLMSSGDGVEMATDSREQFRIHPDPRVGFALRRGEGMKILESTFSADRLGVRGRPGGAGPPGARRVVILGDSVAFGAGVNDDETLACQLETMLASALAEGAAPITCHTVASTGWNHRNAVSFLLDHYDEYDPDWIVYIPIENDLTDTYGVYENGNRRIGHDAVSPRPWIAVNDEPRFLLTYHLAQRVWDGEVSETIDPSEVGPAAITADLSAESSRRYDENVASIARLRRAADARGARVALLFYTEEASRNGHTWILRECFS